MDGRTVKTPRQLPRRFRGAFTLTLTRRVGSFLSADARQPEGHHLPVLLERERSGGADSHSLDFFSSTLVILLTTFFRTQFYSLLGFGSR